MNVYPGRGLPVRILALVLATLAVLPVAAQEGGLSQEETLVISRNQRSRIRIVLEAFSAGPGAGEMDARLTQEVVSQDLDYSGVFRVLTVPALEEGQLVSGQGYEALVRGTVEVANGQLLLRGTLESLPARNLIFTREYRTRAETYREAAHRFADDIVLYLTGETGIARTRVVFVLDNGKSKELYTVDYDGHGLKPLTSNGSINLTPVWSPDLSRIAYVSYQRGDADVFVRDLASGEDRLVAGGTGVQSAPAWSPVGDRLAFSETVSGRSGIHVVSPAGTGQRRLVEGGGINTYPAWSPDGRRIVFTSDRAGNPQLYLVDSEGGSPERLTFGGKWNDLPAWAPDGSRIAFSSREGSVFRIYEVDPAGLSNYRQLTFGPGSDESPRWAPDARHLVFSSSRGGSRGLYVLNTDDGTVRPLVVGRGECYAPHWSGVPKP